MSDNTAPATVWDRLRLRIDRHRTVLIVAVLLVVLAGGVLTVTAYGADEQDTELRTTDQWETTGSLEHQATVTNGTTLYANGSTLENRPLYFTAISPVLDVSVGGGYLAATGDEVAVSLNVTLVSQSVDGETTYWEDRRMLASESEASVESGEQVVADVEVPVGAAMERLRTIERELGAQPGEPQLYLAIELRIDGTIDGHTQARTVRDNLVIHASEGTYSVDEPLQLDRTMSVEEEVAVPVAAGPVRRYGGPAFLGFGFLGMVGLALARPLSTAQRDRLIHRLNLARYDEVILAVDLPPSDDRPVAEVGSLGDLARLAIDLEAVVAHDSDRDLYQTITGEMRYVYRPPTAAPESPDPPTDPTTSAEGEALVADGAGDQ